MNSVKFVKFNKIRWFNFNSIWKTTIILFMPKTVLFYCQLPLQYTNSFMHLVYILSQRVTDVLLFLISFDIYHIEVFICIHLYVIPVFMYIDMNLHLCLMNVWMCLKGEWRIPGWIQGVGGGGVTSSNLQILGPNFASLVQLPILHRQCLVCPPPILYRKPGSEPGEYYYLHVI